MNAGSRYIHFSVAVEGEKKGLGCKGNRKSMKLMDADIEVLFPIFRSQTIIS